MNPSQTENQRAFVIAHATDLSAEGGVAFRHGVRLGERANATLYSLHANPDGDDAERDMPDARTLLASWRMADAAEAFDHRTVVHTCCEDPVDTLLDALGDIKPDLLVVGTRRPLNARRLLRESQAESLALNAGVPTLFLPIGIDGFVAGEDGAMSLERILVPVDSKEAAGAALEAITELLHRIDASGVQLILLHVGDEAVLADLPLPQSDRWSYLRIQRDGDLREEIIGCTEQFDADLIVMATRGHDGLMDFLRGSHTERVIRSSPCPVLSVLMENS